MKSFGWRYFVLACLFAGLSVVSAAQTVGLSVDVPFEFNVGEKLLPAGHYLINAPQGHTLRIVGPKGVDAMVLTNPVSGNRPAGVRVINFNCYGNRCFLWQIWGAETDTGKELPTSRTEKETARQGDQVAVIALRATQLKQRQQNKNR